jgi:hypothetical protein
MNAFLRTWLERQKADKFAAFAGALIDGTVPLRDDVVNELLQDAIVGRSGQVLERCFIASAPEGLINVSFKPAYLPLQSLQFKIEQGVARFPDEPRWKLQLIVSGWLARLGLQSALSLLLSTVLSLFPRWRQAFRVAGSVVEVDWQALATALGAAEYLPYVREFSLSTADKTLLLHFTLHITDSNPG